MRARARARTYTHGETLAENPISRSLVSTEIRNSGLVPISTNRPGGHISPRYPAELLDSNPGCPRLDVVQMRPHVAQYGRYRLSV